MQFIYALAGSAYAALFFIAGWWLRDAVGVSKGEPPVVLRQSSNQILEDWDVPEEA